MLLAPPTRACSIWDDGTANPEPCLDQFTLVSKYGALGWLLGGMSIFAVAGTWASYSAPEKRVPWVSMGHEPAGLLVSTADRSGRRSLRRAARQRTLLQPGWAALVPAD